MGVTVHSENFSNGPIWMSFRRVKDFSLTDLWEIFYSAAQSNNNISLQNAVTVKCAVVEHVRGGMNVKLDSVDTEKRSILTIRNDDNLCLPRSLVAGFAYAVRGQIRTGRLHETWSKVRVSRGRYQKNLAMELLQLASVTPSEDGGCGLDDLTNFQLYFALQATAIIVYASSEFGKGSAPLYNGSDIVIEKAGKIEYTIYLLYYENIRHFQPILSLVGAAGCRGFCVHCHKGYEKIENHKCASKCVKCFQSPPCDNLGGDIIVIKCRECGRDFFGPSCFEKHLKEKSFDRKISVCNGVRICKTCCKIIRKGKNKIEHECGKTFCRICWSMMPQGHFCYMKPITSTPVNATDAEVEEGGDKSKILYIFYDFETTQSNPVVGDEEKKIHVPNLCVAHKICSDCFDLIDIKQICVTCGIREFIFDIDPVQQLLDLALDFRKKFRKIICVAHNSSGFDGNFILKYLIEKNSEKRKPSLILNGCKIISMDYSNIRFIDSLLYFHMPLSALPLSY